MNFLGEEHAQSFLPFSLVSFFFVLLVDLLRLIEVTLGWWWRWRRCKLGSSSSLVPLKHSLPRFFDYFIHLIDIQLLIRHASLFTPWIGHSFDFIRSFKIQSFIKRIKNSQVVNIPSFLTCICFIQIFWWALLLRFFGFWASNSYFIKPLLNLIKQICRQCRLLLRISHISDINFIFSIKCLNLLQNPQGIMLNWFL